MGDDSDRPEGGSAAQAPPPPPPPPPPMPAPEVGSRPAEGAPAAAPPARVLRIGDAERHRVIDELRVQVGDGRLTLDEFAERADQVWRATTAPELAPVLADLPAPPAAPRRADAAPQAASAVGRRTIVAVMSGARVRGRWQVAPRLSVTAFWGGAHVDLRHAVITSPVVDINAVAIMGSILITVPEGIPVEMDGSVLMGGWDNGAPADLVLPGAPLVRVHAMGMWAGIKVRSRPNRVADEPADHAPNRRQPGRRREHPTRAVAPHTDPPPTTREVDVRAPGPATDPEATYPEAPDLRTADPTRPGPPTAPNALPTGTLTMLFTDIVGSTPLVEEMGDRRWSQVVRDHDTAVRAVVASHAGTVVKGEGDGYLIVFASARQAVLAALGLQRAVQSLDHDLPGSRLAIRTGLHTGEVIAQEGDVFGRNVIAAARIAATAAPGQVLVSSLTKELVDSGGDLSFDEGREVELQGLARPWRVHEVRSD